MFWLAKLAYPEIFRPPLRCCAKASFGAFRWAAQAIVDLS
jgi:hypothetical protein